MIEFTRDAHLVDQLDAAWLDVEREEAAAAHKARFFEALRRLGELYGVDLLDHPKRPPARWDTTRDPPQLVEATVRFRMPGARPRRKRARGP